MQPRHTKTGDDPGAEAEQMMVFPLFAVFDRYDTAREAYPAIGTWDRSPGSAGKSDAIRLD